MSLMVSLLAALFLGSGIILVSGENPIQVFEILFMASFGSVEGLGYTLFYATPLIFTGLAVALPFRAGLFNIGGEGQLLVSALAISAFAPLAAPLGMIGVLACVLVGALIGSLWAGIVGILKIWRGCHEVIATIMLNFIALNLVNYCILYLLKDPNSQRAETLPIASSLHLPMLGFGESPLNFSFLVAVAMAILSWFILFKTHFGMKLRACGLNSEAVQSSGYSAKFFVMASMFLGGALASGAAMNEVLGNSHRLIDGFSPGFGFMGIAVAFLGRNHPLGILVSAVFMGALLKGAGDLDIETENMTRDFSVVLQALFILAVGCDSWIKSWIEKLRRNRGN